MKRQRQLGQSLVEFTFVGIPLIFVMISIFEISRGMWTYQTLAHASQEATRYASVHGFNCNPTTTALPTPNNNCAITAANIATNIQFYGVGLDPAKTTLTLTSNGGVVTCALNACGATVWPPNDGSSNVVGAPITVKLEVPFRSAIAMLWPGAHAVSFGVTNMAAVATETIKF